MARTIRKMSGLVQPSGYTTDLLRERFMAEAGLVTISKRRMPRLAQNCKGGIRPARTHCNYKRLAAALGSLPTTRLPLQRHRRFGREVYVSEYRVTPF